MDGVFLAAIMPSLRERIEGRRCTAVGVPVRPGLGLRFRKPVLVLSALPESPDLWWEEDGCPMASPTAVWKDHLEGARVGSARQMGLDRVLVIGLDHPQAYDDGGIRLVFEITGRNANVILVRSSDDRILACLRRIGPKRSRYRTVVPGATYQAPPPSGLGRGEWGSSRDRLEKPPETVTSKDVYSILEGVGPVTAEAVLTEARDRSVTPYEVVMEMKKALEKEVFTPWQGPRAPLPVRLGPGEPIDDPLGPHRPGKARELGELARREYIRHLNERMGRLSRRRENAARALENVTPPATYRDWGNLLLTQARELEKGATVARLEDWRGNEVEIPLKPSRSPVENAQRYFRKARNGEREIGNLRKIVRRTEREIRKLRKEMEKVPDLDLEEIEARLGEIESSPSAQTERPLAEVRLAMGWRCFVGRNARENEKLTFGLGKRGDLWLHARGETGGHVLLKRDGKPDNPPRKVLLQAAALAAYSSRKKNTGVVPVDYTEIQKVRRMKGGKPGQVVYSDENTLFVDLSSYDGEKLARSLDRSTKRQR
ncbi:DUF814 domain-containing protein [Candidatus Fermentibacteria bacterium]|nr:DUF814 domain-containing protein [Candidatus Fermentibacteria bacterium]